MSEANDSHMNGGTSMAAWRFVECEDDGRLWMANPSELHAIIDVRVDTGGGSQWCQIAVVTRRWVSQRLQESERAVFPAMLVVADAEPGMLRASIDDAVSTGELEQFAAQRPRR